MYRFYPTAFFGRQSPLFIPVLSISIALFTAPCQAQLFYDFVQDGTGDVLATMELAELPAGFDDLVGLTFTPAGETIFGVGPAYLGTFDELKLGPGGPPQPVLIDGVEGDGAGGLVASSPYEFAQWTDVDPPYPSFPPDGGPPGLFTVNVGDGTLLSPDGLFIHSATWAPIFVWGDWQFAFSELPGDLDGDGFVGINDLNIVLGNWNQNVPPANPLADPNGDGFVGIDDLNTVLGNWNAGTPPTGTTHTPEPGTVLLLISTGGVLLMRRTTA